MHEHNAFGFANEVECPVERRVAAAKDDDIFAFENGRILAAVMELSALKLFDAFDAERARLEGAHAGCDDHDFAVELAA